MTLTQGGGPERGSVTGWGGLRVAVVVPTYNEAQNLPELIAQLDALKVDGLGYVVVDDGSPDGTGDVADTLAAARQGRFLVIHRKGKQGLGTAYVAGFKAALDAGAEFIVEMDADLSHPVSEVPAMVAKLKEADVVIGSRYRKGGSVDPGWSFVRKQTSAWGNRGIRLIMGLKVKDATSGFKSFRRGALEKIGLDTVKIAGYGFQAEVTYACQKSGLRIVEHPYAFIDRKAGKSKMTMGIAFEAFYRLTLIHLRGR